MELVVAKVAEDEIITPSFNHIGDILNLKRDIGYGTETETGKELEEEGEAVE